ncbi:MAG: 4Fe-4S binding protein [Candidatus Bathyarchaeia archaeon]
MSKKEWKAPLEKKKHEVPYRVGAYGLPGWKKMGLGPGTGIANVIPAVPFGQGNPSFKTGSTRTQRPITDTEKCNLDKLCWLYCPDGARSPDPDTYFAVDLDYCKGCGVCAAVCPEKAITMQDELKWTTWGEK